MKLQDQEAIKFLRKANLGQVSSRIDDYPESDVEGKSDWQMIADEASWVLSEYRSYESSLHEDLEEARRILSLTRYGKVTAYDWNGKPYSQARIQLAKDSVNSYKRLLRFIDRLAAVGYRGRWL